MRGDCSGANIEGDAQSPFAKTRQDGDDVASLAQSDGDPPFACAQRLLEVAQNLKIGVCLAKSPLPGERRLQPA